MKLRGGHAAVVAAERALLGEATRAPSREHWQRMATGYEDRAAAWRLLAQTVKPDTRGHVSRAMELAADADMARARMLRDRLAVSG